MKISMYRILSCLVLCLFFANIVSASNVDRAGQPDGQLGGVYQDENTAQPDVASNEAQVEVETHFHAAGGHQIEPGVVYQDEQAALATDVALLAKEANLTAESIAEAIAFQQAFATYADELLARFPEQITAVWTEPAPSTQGHIQFTGDVPAEIAAEIAQRGLLNSNNVVLSGGGQISMADQQRRAELAAEALGNLGYQNTVTFFDPVAQVIQIELQLPEGAAQPTVSDLVTAVQNRVAADQEQRGMAGLQGRAAAIEAADLQLMVLTGSGPIMIDDHSRGGNWLRDDGVRECTSGWSVSGPNGDGIITAGHCTGLNQFEEPGVAPYGMTFRREVWGTGGDVEYHTTTHAELAEFYATATAIRSVTGTRSTGTMVGNSVCLYGRSSNVRTCDHTVQAIGVTVTFSGVTVSNLARTNSTSSIGGDSGGGWSFDNVAWGINKGHDSSGRGYFTPVRQAQTVLNVTVKTQ